MCDQCDRGTLGRRGLLMGGLALSLAVPFGGRAFAQTTATPPASPDEAIQRQVLDRLVTKKLELIALLLKLY